MQVTNCNSFSLGYPSELASTGITIDGTTNNVVITFWKNPFSGYCAATSTFIKRITMACGVCDAETQLSVPCPTAPTTAPIATAATTTTNEAVLTIAPLTSAPTPAPSLPQLCNCGASDCAGQCFYVKEKCDLNGLLCPTNLVTAFVGDIVGTDALYNVTYHASSDLLCSALPVRTISQPCGVCDPTTQISITCRGNSATLVPTVTTVEPQTTTMTTTHTVLTSDCDGLEKSRVCGCYTMACTNSCLPGTTSANSCSMDCVNGNCDLATSCACQAVTTTTTIDAASTPPHTDVTNAADARFALSLVSLTVAAAALLFVFSQ